MPSPKQSIEYTLLISCILLDGTEMIVEYAENSLLEKPYNVLNVDKNEEVRWLKEFRTEAEAMKEYYRFAA